MDNHAYYELLAEHIAFFGISEKVLGGLVKYKSGKTLRDVEEAIKGGRLEGLGRADAEFCCMATRLSKVVEIDTKEPLPVYEQRLKALQHA